MGLPDLFDAATAARDEAIERADASVATSPGGDALVAKVTIRLMLLLEREGRRTFTADDLAVLLDDAGVARDLKSRRRLVSTIINRGKGKRWVANGFVLSHDPRRNARPVTRWRVA